MNIEELKKQVIIEVSNLKKYATKEELYRLNFDKLNPIDNSNCIYGQITGDCYNSRASDLIKKCTRVYYDNMYIRSVVHSIDEVGYGERNCSPIELYITLNGAKNKTLIDFLKGEIDSLTIKDL